MKVISRFIRSLVLLCLPSLIASGQITWPTPANVLVFNDFTSMNTEVNADLWVGGNLTVSNFSVGKDLNGVPANHPSLVVGNDLKWKNGQVFYGRAFVGGMIHQAPNVLNGSLNNYLTPGLSFSQLLNQSRTLSSTLAAAPATASAVNHFNTLNFSGNSGLNVFNLTPGELQNIHTFKFNAPQDALMIVNVSGASYQHLANTGINPNDLTGGLGFGNILFNFHEATKVDLGRITGFGGSLLAPDAHVTGPYGSFSGQLVASSYKGNYEFYDFPLTSFQFSPIPEPAVYGPLAALTLGGLIVRRILRRRCSEAKAA